jgi:formylglycine-generating enzyme required for sulfatase activity
VLVLDQFEQWLHARQEERHPELVEALRQCDGRHVQSLVLVRDDFWMAVTRFLRELEVPLLEGRNSAPVDLFNRRHARKVLAALGRAFGALPEGSLTPEHERFLDQAVAELARDDKIIAVQLSLFAEMVKGKPWTPATLKAVGGTEGIGMAFLEETFSAATAPPQHRLHQKAARAVLQALLPEQGGDIKGALRSGRQLLAVSGYAGRPRDFEDLLHILDIELRLVTPTDSEGLADDQTSRPASGAETRYYQLTHEYLVAALRQWLTRKQRETRRGRAELRLAERTALWNTKREHRHLPAWWEWANIRLFTRRQDWTEPQRRMMQQTGRYHALRAGVLAVLLALAGWGATELYGSLRATALVQTLAGVETADVPKLLPEVTAYRRWAESRLKRMAAPDNPDAKERLHASLALVAGDPMQVDYLYERLLTARPEEVPVLRDALRDRPDVTSRLWRVLIDAQAEAHQRLRAASALATYDPDNAQWASVRDEVVGQLMTEQPLVLPQWAETLRPLRGLLAELLVQRIGHADVAHSERLLILLRAYRDEAVPLLRLDLDRKAPPSATEDARGTLAKRQAQVAVALLQLGHVESVWPLLLQSPDPTLRTYLIHRFAAFGVNPAVLMQRLEVEPDASVRRALVLSLGEFSADQLPMRARQALVEKLLLAYREEPDAGLHGAIDWLLEHWGHDHVVRRIEKELTSPQATGPRRWYVNGQGQTFTIIFGPVEFQMGTPKESKYHLQEEALHRRHIPRSFAIATKEVTNAQFKQFRRDHQSDKRRSPDEDGPVILVDWYTAAAYCNWLSQQEGIPQDQWCYLVDEPAGKVKGVKLAADYLRRTGYRLPTEAEWEYACRAATGTEWHCGSAEEMLGNYSWYSPNAGDRAHRVGVKKPNDLGLFDMHGNAWEWCQDQYASYPRNLGATMTDDKEEDNKDIDDFNRRLLRSGAFLNLASGTRSAARYGSEPANRYDYYAGFRPARTYR